MFQGRKDELSVLEKRYQSDRFEFGFVYGQRRIGKTSLINEFGKTHKTLLFFATDSDDVSIRRDFSNQLFAFLDRPGLGGFENWESFFLAI
jgi:AAA+ ATPase superfamily predicted ATPase